MSRRQKRSGNPLLDTLSAERERTQDRSRQKTHGSATVQSCCCGAAAAEAASDLEDALDVEDLREPEISIFREVFVTQPLERLRWRRKDLTRTTSVRLNFWFYATSESEDGTQRYHRKNSEGVIIPDSQLG